MLPYIAGFFDADGSVGIVRFKPNETKQLAVTYTNTDHNILYTIKQFIETEYGIKGWITTAQKREEHHLQSKQLIYYRQSALKVMKLMEPYILHNKKKVRLKIFEEEYRPLIKANGKYSKEERDQLEFVAEKIMNIKF